MQGEGVPSVGVHLVLQHWGTGIPLWSGGSPETDALVTASYVRAYFNSSDPERLPVRRGLEDATLRGRQLTEEEDTVHGGSAACAIPDATATDARGR